MSRRRWLALATLLTLAGGVYWAYDSERRHLEFCHAVDSELRTLGKKRPPGISRQQWEYVLGWTLNDFRGYLAEAKYISQADRNSFLAELRTRLNGPVDLGTIDWLYAELDRLKAYSGRLFSRRPTTPERLQEFEEGRGGIDCAMGLVE
jgi:hypothetical protein